MTLPTLHEELFAPLSIVQEELAKMEKQPLSISLTQNKVDLLYIFSLDFITKRQLELSEFAMEARNKLTAEEKKNENGKNEEKINKDDKEVIISIKEDSEVVKPVEVVERREEVSERDMMNLIHELFEKTTLIKQSESTILSFPVSFIWQVKEDFLKTLKENNFHTVRKLWILRKSKVKLFLRLKDLLIKNNKTTKNKFKPSDIDSLQKKLNEVDRAKSKLERDWEKYKRDNQKHIEIQQKKIKDQLEKQKKEEDKRKKLEEKRLREERLKKEKLEKQLKQQKEKEEKQLKQQKEKEEKQRLLEEKKEKQRLLKEEKAREQSAKKKNKKTVNNENELSKKQNIVSIQNFFTKKQNCEIEKPKLAVKFNRYSSFGGFDYKLVNPDKGRENIETLFGLKQETEFKEEKIENEENPFNRKIDFFSRKPRIKEEGKKLTKFIRFEDYLNNASEYRGYIEREERPKIKDQLVRFIQTVNYELMTDDEIQLLDADSLEGSMKDSEEDDADNHDNDFLVPDSYVSDNEDDTNKANKKVNSTMLTELTPLKINFSEIGKEDEVIKKFKAINLWPKKFPIPVIPIKQLAPEEPKLDNIAFGRILRLSTGLPTKKRIYDTLIEQSIDFPKKLIYKTIQETSTICYFVNPVDFSEYVKEDYYTVLMRNIRNPGSINDINGKTFLEALVLLLHGSLNTVENKDKKIYNLLKRKFRYLTKANLDKIIKNIARVGIVYHEEVLEKTVG